MKLVISLATRGRPQQLVETINKSRANWTHPETLMSVACDEDDQPTIAAVLSLNPFVRHPMLPLPQTGIMLDVRLREDTIAAKWNRATEIPADVYLVAADDDPYVTPGYDTKLLDAAARFPDGIGMVYGHMANASFSGVVAPTRKLVDKLGGIFPTYFPYWFADHWTDDIARIIDRISFADVRTDQSRAGKTQEMREPGWWATWFDAACLMRRRAAHDIIKSDDFQEPQWRKDLLLAHHPLIEFRSRFISDNVRLQARQLENWSAIQHIDARYRRSKDAAIAMLPQMFEGMDAADVMRFRYALTPPDTITALPRASGWS